jgi:hypothetical protein
MSIDTAYPATPELEKLKAAAPRSQHIGEFLEWLGTRGIVLCCYQNNILIEKRERPEKLLAQFYEIDLDKVEQERRQILEYIHSAESKLKK